MNHSLSIREAFNDGWATLRAHSSLVFKVVLSFFALEVAYAIVTRVLGGTLLGFCAALLLIIVGMFMSTGVTLIALRLARGEKAHYRDLLPPAALVINYLLASILAGVVTLLPVALLGLTALVVTAVTSSFVLPMIVLGAAAVCASLYLALRYFFVKFAAVDGSTPVASLRKSAFMTAGEKWRLALFLLAAVGVNVLGLLCLVVGLLVTIPLSVLALAHVYVRLASR
jgi:hypothetical protein